MNIVIKCHAPKPENAFPDVSTVTCPLEFPTSSKPFILSFWSLPFSVFRSFWSLPFFCVCSLSVVSLGGVSVTTVGGSVCVCFHLLLGKSICRLYTYRLCVYINISCTHAHTHTHLTSSHLRNAFKIANIHRFLHHRLKILNEVILYN